MVSIKFRDIIKEENPLGNVIQKATCLKKKIGKTKAGIKFLKVIFAQEGSKCEASAWDDDKMKAWQKRLKIGREYTFSSNTFKTLKRNYNHPSEATVGFTLRFIRLPKVKNLAEVKQLEKKYGYFPNAVFGLTVKVNEIYRYWGCKECTKKVIFKNGKYLCPGKCMADWTRPVQTEKKICVLLQDVSFSDSYGNNLENVVLFEKEISRIVPNLETFISDSEALEAIQAAFKGRKVSAKFGRVSAYSVFPPAVIAKEVKLLKSRTLKVPEESNPVAATSSGNGAAKNDLTSSNGSNNGTTAATDSKPLSSEYDAIPENQGILNFTLSPLGRVVVKRAPSPNRNRKLVVNSEFVYPMTPGTPRGVVLLINNHNFEDRIRFGSEKDVQYLTNLFLDMEYEIFGGNCFTDVQTNEELQQIFRNYKSHLLAVKATVAITVIMSHGIMGEIELIGGSHANVVQDILTPFSDEGFEDFVGKPKLFIFQACQKHEKLFTETPEYYQRHPGFSDMIICYPAIPGFYAFRTREGEGSPFIHTLTKVFAKHAWEMHVNKLMEMVQEKMYEKAKKKGCSAVSPPFALPIVFGQLYLLPQDWRTELRA